MVNEVYFSCDIESDGGFPGLNSMLQIGLVPFDEKWIGSGVSFTLEPLPEARVDQRTFKWWMETPEKVQQWKNIHSHGQSPAAVIPQIDYWIRKIAKERECEPVCCASPAGFDWCFLRYYLLVFAANRTGETVFGHRCWDARSHAMGILARSYLESGRSGLPEEWFKGQPRLKEKLKNPSHSALSDAENQARMFQIQLIQAKEQAKKSLNKKVLVEIGNGKLVMSAKEGEKE